MGAGLGSIAAAGASENDRCDSGGGRCCDGCVATAFRFLMSLHPFLLRTEGSGRVRPVIQDATLLEQLAACKFGCVVAELRPADAEALGFAAVPEPLLPGSSSSGGGGSGAVTANAPLALSAWKGKASLAIMVDRNETQQMMDKITAAMAKADNVAAPAVPSTNP